MYSFIFVHDFKLDTKQFLYDKNITNVDGKTVIRCWRPLKVDNYTVEDELTADADTQGIIFAYGWTQNIQYGTLILIVLKHNNQILNQNFEC